MFGIGTGELLLLLVLALLVLGPERMPKLARDVGKTMTDLRKTSDELRTEFMNADKALRSANVLDVAAKRSEPKPAGEPPQAGKAAEMGATAGATQPTVPPDAGATQAEAATGPSVTRPETKPTGTSSQETAFDKEARLARERLEEARRTDTDRT